MNLREIFQSDRAILIACICISGIFWIMNKMSQPVNWERTIPIHYEIPEGFVFSETPRESLVFTAEGTGWQLLALSRRDVDSMLITIPSKAGNHTWNNDQLRQMIKDEILETDISIPKVTPFRLSISLTEAKKRCYAVELDKRITYASGYQNVSPVSITPDSICITGPADQLPDQKAWPVDSLILNNISGSVKGKLAVVNDHPKLLTAKPATVSYNLEVAEFTELKKYATIRIVNEPEKDSVSLFPGRALVSMQVPLDRYDQAKEQDINLFVDLGKEEKGSNISQIKIPDNMPEWMKNIQVNPQTVEYYFVSKDTSGLDSVQ